MKSNWFKNNWLILVTGLVIGIAALVLGAHGNPGNMGFCIACFLRDTTGALGLHGAEVVQYFRPEIVGILLGSLIAAVAAKEFKGRGGSSPMIRFLLGVFVMIGALMFLGCPLRMVIRIGGGDWNALVGLVGFIVGILVGVVFLKKGFTLGRSYKQTLAEGAAFPVVYVLLFVLWLAAPAIFKFSEKGPGSMHAAWGLALVAGLVVGALCQRSRMCMVGGIRNAVMFKDFGLVAGFVTIILTVLVGWGSVLLGGCPLRQLILAAQGNGDSAVTVFGMIVGAALAHNFGLAGNPDSKNEAGQLVVGGISTAGKVAVIVGLVVLLVIALWNMPKKEAAK